MPKSTVQRYEDHRNNLLKSVGNYTIIPGRNLLVIKTEEGIKMLAVTGKFDKKKPIEIKIKSAAPSPPGKTPQPSKNNQSLIDWGKTKNIGEEEIKYVENHTGGAKRKSRKRKRSLRKLSKNRKSKRKLFKKNKQKKIKSKMGGGGISTNEKKAKKFILEKYKEEIYRVVNGDLYPLNPEYRNEGLLSVHWSGRSRVGNPKLPQKEWLQEYSDEFMEYLAAFVVDENIVKILNYVKREFLDNTDITDIDKKKKDNEETIKDKLQEYIDDIFFKNKLDDLIEIFKKEQPKRGYTVHQAQDSTMHFFANAGKLKFERQGEVWQTDEFYVVIPPADKNNSPVPLQHYFAEKIRDEKNIIKIPEHTISKGTLLKKTETIPEENLNIFRILNTKKPNKINGLIWLKRSGGLFVTLLENNFKHNFKSYVHVYLELFKKYFKKYAADIIFKDL